MNDRIKFRAWDETLKRMDSWNDLKGGSLIVYLEMPTLHLMQSTGLKDKNRVLIFEGDILDGQYCPKGLFGSYGSLKSEVTHAEGCYWVQDPNGWPHHLYELAPKNQTAKDELILNCEIIGNIYENPELLK